MKTRIPKPVLAAMFFLFLGVLACNLPTNQEAPAAQSAGESQALETPMSGYVPLVQAHEVEPADGKFPGVIREPSEGDIHYMGAIGYQMNIKRCDDPGDNFERDSCDLEVWNWYRNEVYKDSTNGIVWFQTWAELQKFLQEKSPQITEIRILFNETLRVDPMRPGEARVLVSNLHLLDATLPMSDGTMFFTWDVHPNNPQDEELYLPWPPQ